MADLTFLKPLLKERGIKIKDFCAGIGVTEQGFAKLIKSNSTKIDTLELIAEKLDIPMARFFADRPSTAQPVIDVNYMEVPIVPVYAQAGYLKGFGDREYIEALPTMPVMVDRAYRGHYRIFEIKGDSMDDGSAGALLNGDSILCREVRREFWTSHLHIRDWYFVIVHRTEGITVKQITEHNVADGTIRCHPLNPLFEDFTLNLSDVVELYNVVSLARRELKF